ncbi:MAG: enoyl-CoA hydratase/isomerase family protein [Alcaligenes sp.]
MNDPFGTATAGLRIERQDGVWILTLDRPDKRNALSADLVEALIAAVGAAEHEQADLLVLRGEGRNFSAGFDFTDYERHSEGDLLLRFVRIETLLQKLAYSPCATLALAHGQNFGAGADLLAACRTRVASVDARFRMPGLQFGLALGTRRLAALVGAQRAHDLLAASRTFSAEQALDMGFVQEIREPQDWPELIGQAGAQARALSPESRRLLQDLTRLGDNPDGDMAALARSASAPGIKERIAAFRQAAAGQRPL